MSGEEVSTLAAHLAGVFVFKGTPSVIDALSCPRILIYAASARHPAPASQTFYPYIRTSRASAVHLAVVCARSERASDRSRVPGYVHRFRATQNNSRVPHRAVKFAVI